MILNASYLHINLEKWWKFLNYHLFTIYLLFWFIGIFFSWFLSTFITSIPSSTWVHISLELYSCIGVKANLLESHPYLSLFQLVYMWFDPHMDYFYKAFKLNLDIRYLGSYALFLSSFSSVSRIANASFFKSNSSITALQP